MISIIDSGKLANTENNPMIPRSAELVGLSGDTKPTGVSVGNGWSFIEMDTGKVFFYNAADEEWLEFAGSGGGGGQGGNNVMIVTATATSDTITLDKTWKEINEAEFAIIKYAMTANDNSYIYIMSVVDTGSAYEVNAWLSDEVPLIVFSTLTETGYPSVTMGA